MWVELGIVILIIVLLCYYRTGKVLCGLTDEIKKRMNEGYQNTPMSYAERTALVGSLDPFYKLGRVPDLTPYNEVSQGRGYFEVPARSLISTHPQAYRQSPSIAGPTIPMVPFQPMLS